MQNRRQSFKILLSPWRVLILAAVAALSGCGMQSLNKLNPQDESTSHDAQTQPSDKVATFAPPPQFLPPPLTERELSSEVPGDSAPPEVRTREEAAMTEKLFYLPPPLPPVKKVRRGHGKPVQFAKKKVKNVPLYQVTVDLDDPESYLVIRLPGDATQANCPSYTRGHELFETFVKHYPASILMNGTFFSKDEQERVMGNMVSEGRYLKYSQWENYGTTLSLSKQDEPDMVTARAEGKPVLDEKWFSITCGPRLVKHGEIWLYPELEGFTDPHVLGAGPRCALGFSKSRKKLYLVSFLRGLTLHEEALIMKELGCYEAMNLDGGASKALAENNSVILKPGRGLTNVLVVYDSKNKAPSTVTNAWQAFQSEGARVTPLQESQSPN